MRDSARDHYMWLAKSPVFWLSVLADICCIIAVVYCSIKDFEPGLITHSSTVLAAHTAPAYCVIITGILIDHLLLGKTPVMLIVTVVGLGAFLCIILALIQLFNLPKFDQYKSHIIILIIISFIVSAINITIITILFACPGKAPESNARLPYELSEEFEERTSRSISKPFRRDSRRRTDPGALEERPRPRTKRLSLPGSPNRHSPRRTFTSPDQSPRRGRSPG